MSWFRRRHRPHGGDGSDTVAPDQWHSVVLPCNRATADLLVARLRADGFDVRRPSLSNLSTTTASAVPWGAERIEFRERDRGAVRQTLADFDLL